MMQQMIPIASVNILPQIRTRNGFDEESLRELADTIKQHGLLQPIIVSEVAGGPGRFDLIAGERRVLAATLAGFDHLPALVYLPGEERDADAVQAVENLQRVDLALFDRAAGVAKLVKKHGSKPTARMLGKSPAWVSKHLSASRVSEPVRLAAQEGDVEDLEVLLSVQALGQHSATPIVADLYQTALGELAAGTLSRSRARSLLDQANNQAQDARDDGPGDDDGHEDAGDVSPAKPVSLKIDPADCALIAKALKAYAPTKRADLERRDALALIFARAE